jgi:predicted GNAT family N-acyltransferase
METDQNLQSPEFVVALVRTAEEREAVFVIRVVVFVEEQAVPIEEELDAYDVLATHFLVRQTGLPSDDPASIVATARLVDKGAGIGKIGRVAVLKPWRSRGIGALLMRSIEQYALEQGFTRLMLEAQCYAIPFYEKLGYIAEGDIFLDADIEHRMMQKEIGQTPAD